MAPPAQGWALLHPSSRTSLSLHLTALRTLLSKGFLLGSLVEDRIPVPQLLARVFLWVKQRDILGEGIRASPALPCSLQLLLEASPGFQGEEWEMCMEMQ